MVNSWCLLFNIKEIWKDSTIAELQAAGFKIVDYAFGLANPESVGYALHSNSNSRAQLVKKKINLKVHK